MNHLPLILGFLLANTPSLAVGPGSTPATPIVRPASTPLPVGPGSTPATAIVRPASTPLTVGPGSTPATPIVKPASTPLAVGPGSTPATPIVRPASTPLTVGPGSTPATPIVRPASTPLTVGPGSTPATPIVRPASTPLTVGPGSTPATILLVVGAPGEPGFDSNFVHQAHLWQSACQQHQVQSTLLGLQPNLDPDSPQTTSNTGTDRHRLELELSRIPKSAPDPLWIILIGHGTFDGQEARFNLRGPDVTARELATWLQPFQRPVILINTASASAPFIPALSATNRTILTATRSGNEVNATRFGRCIAEALSDPLSDLDQDGEISLLELFLRATHRVSDFYATEGRLLTEHALLDDNGDSRGTPAEWFRGLRATKAPEAGATLDGTRARQLRLFPSAADLALTPAQRELRNTLELQIETLRGFKTSLPPDEYYRRLETILLELARLLHTAPQAEGEK